jgi:hypothetical protein
MRMRKRLVLLLIASMCGCAEPAEVGTAEREITGSRCPPPTLPPVLLAPSGVLDVSNDRPTFSWIGVPGATEYTLFVIREDNDLIELEAHFLLGTSFTPPSPLVHGVPLRWKVRGENSCGAGPYSLADNHFIIGPPCTPPTEAPTALLPEGPQDPLNTRPLFTWTAVPNATEYTLQVWRPAGGPFEIDDRGITGTSFMPSGELPAGVELRWSVKGTSSCADGPVSGQLDFIIGTTCSPLAAPTTISPAGVMFNENPTFRWTPVSGAHTYTVAVFEIPSDTLVFNASGIHGTSYTGGGSLPDGVQLRWKVKAEAEGACGPGDWSPDRLFAITPWPGGPVCGDDVCAPGESCLSCPYDCSDCGPSCGEIGGNHCGATGSCPPGYHNLGTTYDCNPCCLAPWCGDGVCQDDEGCGCADCDCGPSCGALGGDLCSPTPWCPPAHDDLGPTWDCARCCLSNGSTCGNGWCDEGEPCGVDCAFDCGVCPDHCGDGLCEDWLGESCWSCEVDCATWCE